MKFNKINSLFCGLITLLFISCSSTEKTPYKPIKVEKNKVYKKDYELDHSYFKKNKLPIPEVFNGNYTEYLTTRNDTLKSYDYDYFDDYDEEEALKFFKDLDVRGYGDNSPYWRWKTTLTTKEFYNGIKYNLPKVYAQRPNEVLTLVDNKWTKKWISTQNIGTIKKVDVAGRGASGIVTYVVIYSSNNTYLVAKELNIRKLFAFNKTSTSSNRDILLFSACGGSGKYSSTPLRKNLTLLPSGYFTLEKSKYSVTLYGGGNGHGVGMSQFGAYDLAQNHKLKYDDILKRYYPQAKLKNMYDIEGISKYINVGVTNSSQSLDHSTVTLYSNGKMRINGAGFKIDVPKKQKVVIVNKGKRLWVSVNGKHRVKTVNPLNITAYGYYITLDNVKKGHTSSPSYRGDMIVKPSNTNNYRIRVINTVKIEDYLKQVVPSEMPQSFGLEALKAQAIAARTYALSDFLKNRYKDDGFHVKDTTESQVYNNQKENPDATEAISKTNGKVLIYDGKPIDAKYYSTGAGFGESSKYVW